MTNPLTVTPLAPCGAALALHLTVCGPPESCVRVEQLGHDLAWEVPTGPDGRGELRVEPVDNGTTPVPLLRVAGAPPVQPFGRVLALESVVEGRVRPGHRDVIYGAGLHLLSEDLDLSAGALVLDAGALVRCGLGVAIRAVSAYLLGTARAPVQLLAAEASRPWGGLRLLGGQSTLRHAYIAHARATRGGGLALERGRTRLEHVRITRCVAELGGGLWIGPGARVIGAGLTLQHNEAELGGGLAAEGARIAIDGLELVENRAPTGAAALLDGCREAVLTRLAGVEAGEIEVLGGALVSVGEAGLWAGPPRPAAPFVAPPSAAPRVAPPAETVATPPLAAPVDRTWAPPRTPHALPTAPRRAEPAPADSAQRPHGGRRGRIASLAATASLALLSLPGLGWAALAGWGATMLEPSLEAGRAKTAVALTVVEAGGEEVVVEHLSGAPLGRSGPYDGQVPVDPAALAPGGPLHLWWEGVQRLEDQHVNSPLGFSPRLPLVLARGLLWELPTGRRGLAELEGGSGLSDQTFGVLRDGSGLEFPSPLVEKAAEIAGGIALRRTLDPREIGALYATHAPVDAKRGLEAFLRDRYGLEGSADPRFTRGHALVLAAMIKHRWKAPDWPWAAIEGRAALALDQLVADGIVAPSERAAIRAEIAAARPPATPPRPSRGGTFDAASRRAVEELYAALGPGWADEVAAVVLTLDPHLQDRARLACEREVDRIGTSPARGPDAAGATCSALVLAEDGAVLAAWVSDERPTEWDGLFDVSLPGASLAKPFIASSVARRGHAAGAPGLAAFEADLRASRPEITRSGRHAGARAEEVADLIACFGDDRQGRAQFALDHAARGDWDTSPARYAAFLAAVHRGEPLPGARVVARVRLRNGTEWAPLPAPPTAEELRCADLAAADGRAASFLALPLEPGGTLERLDGLALGGKTGTAPPAGQPTGTAFAWAAASLEVDGAWRGLVVGLSAAGDRSADLGDAVSGGVNAGRVAASIARATR